MEWAMDREAGSAPDWVMESQVLEQRDQQSEVAGVDKDRALGSLTRRHEVWPALRKFPKATTTGCQNFAWAAGRTGSLMATGLHSDPGRGQQGSVNGSVNIS
jgi:hypothetical protein